MKNSDNKQANNAAPLLGWSKYGALVVQDLGYAILGFIPKGLEIIYNKLFKSIPLLGGFFSHTLVEKVVKLLIGVTLGLELAADLARGIFWPLGFVVGGILEVVGLSHYKRAPNYSKQISQFLFQCAGLTIFCTILSVIFTVMAAEFYGNLGFTFNLMAGLQAAGIGAIVGFLLRCLLLVSINMLNIASMSNIRKNGQNAKALSTKLKYSAKRKAKSRILREAQDIIQKMNGSQAQKFLEDFFKAEFDTIAEGIYKKIDRHFNYLTDRACCGDVNALKRLQSLMPEIENPDSINGIEVILDRIFSGRTIAKMKDIVDTYYDRWYYHSLTIRST